MNQWIQTGENLVRNSASGKYYVRINHAGRDVWKSLKTDKITVARLRKPDAIAKIRARSGTLCRDNLTLGQCVETYLTGKRDAELKPMAYRSVETAVKMIRKQFPGFDARLAEQFTPQDCQTLCTRLRAKYSRRTFNLVLWSVRGILQVALKSKVIAENPAMDVKPLSVEMNRLELPDETQFQNFMDRLRQVPSRSRALAFVRIMALTGHRPESIRRLRVEHVDFSRRLVRWPPIKHNTQFNEVPMTDELETVLRQLVHDHKGDGPLLPIKNPRRALHTASLEARLEIPMNCRMFRHFWTTRALEAGIPVPEVAAMRGDKDGGAMLLRTYVHPRLERMREMVSKLPGTGPRAEVLQKCELKRSRRGTGARAATANAIRVADRLRAKPRQASGA